ncbi:MAG: hypothetical protein GF368_02310, partial [Candidatus Aenigmarchaeota archaeon]|nr:hypothetical protein [Candidatus Aenigmarchaeota archaeon]
MILYPEGPCPVVCPATKSKTVEYVDPYTGKKKKETLNLMMYPGEGIFAQPFESIKYLDLEFPMGAGTGAYISLMYQLGKWGYDREEVSHSIEVSPIYKEYYSLVMEQKQQLDNQIKNGFAALMQAVQDFELIDHDLRKYSEYLKWFAELAKAKKKYDRAREIKNKDGIMSAREDYREAQHIIKSMFIDQVDAHTGEGLSLRGIAPRWPTIISDFMDLFDDDVNVKDIQERLDVPRAEAIILKTKQELYLEWKERFLTNIISRYKRLKKLAMSRKYSIEDTRKDLIPLISRYKSVKDMRADLGAAGGMMHEWLRPDSQALAIEKMEIWAWKPFVIKGEPFPYPRIEREVTLKEAGFNKVERDFLNRKNISKIKPLPAIPIMDRHVRNIMKMISEEHNVTLTAADVVEQVKGLHKKFSSPSLYGGDVQRGGDSAVQAGPRWEWSPYYIFVRIPVMRLVLRLPNGAMLEDMMFDGMQALNTTQNVLIGHLLERQAIIEKERRDIAIMLGYEELLEDEGRTSKIDEILKKEYPQFDFDKGEMSAKWLEKEPESKVENKEGLL